MKKMITALTILLTISSVWAKDNNTATPRIISIAGEWLFHQGDAREYDDVINLPGSMLTNGKGDIVTVNTQWTGSLYDSSFYYNPYMAAYQKDGEVKLPFFLTPSRHYVGASWYKKTVDVPKAWKADKKNGKRVYLHLERPHIESKLLINGKEVGEQMSLSAPHVFDVTDYLKYGSANTIELRIYNGIENVCVGQDSHSVTDQTQGNWNGVIGDMTLRLREGPVIENVQVYPDIHRKTVRVDLKIPTAQVSNEHPLAIIIDGKSTDYGKTKVGSNGLISKEIPLGEEIRLWDEFTPNLYHLTAIYGSDTISTTFGMREIRTEGRKMILNDHEIFIRGTVGNCCFPLTGYPPTDVESWLAVFNKCKDYGLNMMRFHSYCPPEAAFIAADQVGFYLQPEGPSWPNHGVKLGNGMDIDTYLLDETRRMVEEYGNHPSFCMLAAGNEPAGNWVKWVGDFVDYWHATGDDRRIYCGASVGGGWAWDPKSDYHVKGGARGLEWTRRAPQSVDDFAAEVTTHTQKGSTPITFEINEPFLSHEQGQWCAFPDFKEIEQYTGAYKAGNFEIFRDLLRDNGMESRAEDFLHASGKLQVLAYKYEIERNLRTQNYTGFQLLGLNDYSGQGSALVGALNVFWREKGYVTDDEWRQFCSPVVPMAKFKKFVYTADETFDTDIMLYNATTESLGTMPLGARIVDDNGYAVRHFNLAAPAEYTVGKHDVGNIKLPLSELSESIDQPKRYSLVLEGHPGDGLSCYNSYEFWVYPTEVTMPAAADNVYVSDTLDTEALNVLERGGRVLLTAAGKVTMGSDVKQTYLPVFWNTSWFKMRPPHTTGAHIDTDHPIFKHFPTDDWANLNWWELLNNAQVINLREFPTDYQPAIQPIDTWHISRKLGMMAEAQVGNGCLLVTTMDIDSDLEHRPVARQMRKALLEYVNSDDFNPIHQVDIDVIKRLYTDQAPAVDMFTKDSPDELKPKLK